ncbi:MAG: fumarylacetoacetate hydrolase family protein [Gammaproteobacteria bacterium]|nr:fumarylacetoacetate hydrolase family protein [Gammaproteobacteria bacterium]
MKLLRVGPDGQEIPAVVDDTGIIRDVSAEIRDFDPSFLESGGIERLRTLDLEACPAVDASTRIGPPVTGSRKFLCIGLNYRDHAAEAGAAVPEEPILFMKALSAICGPNDSVTKPLHATKLDWEVELAVVIGRRARHVTESQAPDYVAGYCVCNDFSERAFQLERGGQWVKGKSCDGFGPIGPWLVTPDEVGDPQQLDLWLEVNGKRYQSGNTRTMIFPVAHIIHYVSQFMTLEPGDIISTGTPPGVGMGQKPPLYLDAGDTVRLGISGLGEQQQTIVPYPAQR